MEQTECSETSAYKIQTPGNYPKESIQHTEHGESLKLRINCDLFKSGGLLEEYAVHQGICLKRREYQKNPVRIPNLRTYKISADF